MKMLVPGTAAVAIALFAACGGNVVVDGNTGGGTTTLPGAGGTGTIGTGTSNPGVGGATSCFNTPPPASVTPCGGTGSSGGMCEFSYCDSQSGNTWDATCSTNACVCFFNGAEVCSCALSSAGDFCGGTPDCCVHP